MLCVQYNAIAKNVITLGVVNPADNF